VARLAGERVRIIKLVIGTGLTLAIDKLVVRLAAVTGWRVGALKVCRSAGTRTFLTPSSTSNASVSLQVRFFWTDYAFAFQCDSIKLSSDLAFLATYPRVARVAVLNTRLAPGCIESVLV
jgi:hypothetical protein